MHQAFEAQRLRYLESENAELLRQVELMANDAAEAGRREYRCVCWGGGGVGGEGGGD